MAHMAATSWGVDFDNHILIESFLSRSSYIFVLILVFTFEHIIASVDCFSHAFILLFLDKVHLRLWLLWLHLMKALQQLTILNIIRRFSTILTDFNQFPVWIDSVLKVLGGIRSPSKLGRAHLDLQWVELTDSNVCLEVSNSLCFRISLKRYALITVDASSTIP